MKKSNIRILMVAVAALSMGVMFAGRWSRARALDEFHRQYRGDGANRRSRSVRRTPEQWRQWHSERRHFARLWIARHDRDVSAELVKYVTGPHPNPQLRIQAVRALGQLEVAAAEPALMTIESGMKVATSPAAWEAAGGVPLLPLRLANSRIRAKQLSGQAQLDAVVGGVGLKWADVVHLSHVHHTPRSLRPPSTIGDSLAERWLLQEVVDILYAQKVKGTNTSRWESQLMLSPEEKVWLQSATLKRERAAELVLSHLASRKVLNTDAYWLLSRFIGMKGARGELSRYLPKRKENPAPGPDQRPAVGYKAVFYSAAAVLERGALPLISRFEKSTDIYVRDEAKAFRHSLEKNEAVVPELP